MKKTTEFTQRIREWPLVTKRNTAQKFLVCWTLISEFCLLIHHTTWLHWRQIWSFSLSLFWRLDKKYIINFCHKRSCSGTELQELFFEKKASSKKSDYPWGKAEVTFNSFHSLQPLLAEIVSLKSSLYLYINTSSVLYPKGLSSHLVILNSCHGTHWR